MRNTPRARDRLGRLLLSLIVAASSLAGCGSRDVPNAGRPGTLRMALTAEAGGTTYRLQQALFGISGVTDPSFATSLAGDPSAAVVTAQLPAGTYRLQLAEGWYLEELVSGDLYAPVEATLVSPNPTPFTIVANGTTTVVFQFLVHETVVSVGEGTLNVELVVTVTPDLADTVAGTSGALAAGYGHTCVVASGGVRCWGYGYNGQLGNDSTTDSHVPVQVQALTSGVQAIAAGYDHTCAIVNGGLQCWGTNGSGELGNGSTTESHVPVQVQGLTSGVQDCAAGGFHTCAIVNGGVECWGLNGMGQLGTDAASTGSSIPIPVLGLTAGVQAVAAGWEHTCALVNGGVQCWGYDGSGQLGIDSTDSSHVPVQVVGLTSGVQAITAGESHTCALVNGGVQCWGRNDHGQLGNASTADSHVPVPVQGLSSGVQRIAAGLLHTCAIVNGGVRCWGHNAAGELGNGSTTDSSVPVPVQDLSSGVTGVAAGLYFTCALVNGGVRCWGDNASGQLGDGTTVSSSAPVPVTGL